MHVVQKNEHETEVVSWEAAVSSWVDGEGEIRAEELDTPYGRQLWDTYHLIGDVLRTEDLAIKPSPMFYARLSRAIDDEPPIVAPGNLPHGSRHAWRKGLSGLAVAAVVAVVAWVVTPYFMGDPAVEIQAVPATQLASAEPDEDEVLHDYLDAHEGLAGVIPVRLVSYGAGVQP